MGLPKKEKIKKELFEVGAIYLLVVALGLLVCVLTSPTVGSFFYEGINSQVAATDGLPDGYRGR